MAQSPFTVVDLSVERGYYFSGIIETSKDKEEKKIMYLYVALDIPIQVGDILTWRQDNGVIEKWLLLQKVHKVHEQYQTFQILKCNYNLKWIDAEGYLHQSWAYAVSSVDSKVKGNFRMWHSLISPQPNKFAEIIMPRPELKPGTADVDELMRGINFIIENEGWTVIECDWTSVEGIVYMSLTESKVNYQYDDRFIEDVADLDRYKFPELPALYKVGDSIVPQFEADTLNQWEVVLSKPEDCDFINENWVATGAGQCIITMSLKNRPAVTKTVEITINANETDPVYYIEGPDKLRLDRQAKYYLTDGVLVEDVPRVTNSYEINENKKIVISMEIEKQYDENNKLIEYAKLSSELEHPDIFILHANNKNKLGQLVLITTYSEYEWNSELEEEDKWELKENKQYKKTVEIIPLW